MKTFVVPKKKVGSVAGTFQIEDRISDTFVVKTTVYIPRLYLKELGYAENEGPSHVEVLVPEKDKG